MRTILVCEDEASIRDFVVVNLTYAGYRVIEAASGEEALAMFDESVDMALLDIMLPGINGFEVCAELRKRSNTMGIIMLTARSREEEKVDALRLGADDYVTKPFSPSELMARVDALYRRVSAVRERSGPAEELQSGHFVLNVRNRTVSKAGVPLDLTQVEYQMMYLFFLHPGVPIERTEILRQVWGESYIGAEKIVDVNIRRLRMKIEDEPSDPRHICTVRGQGYQWNV
ncbi:MAG: response regulator transcription factor [Clostridia bacterium]|nr:response regulator transcription factor [Clostridia bacterium]